MLQAQLCVTYAALLLGTICFLLFIVTALVTLFKKPAADTTVADIAKAAPAALLKGVSITDFKDLLEAAAKLSDSLAKAGPALSSLIGAVLFYAIAAIASGVLHSPPPVPLPAAASTTAPATGGPAAGKGDPPPVKQKLPPPTKQ